MQDAYETAIREVMGERIGGDDRANRLASLGLSATFMQVVTGYYVGQESEQVLLLLSEYFDHMMRHPL